MRLHLFLKVVCGTGLVVAAQNDNLANAGSQRGGKEVVTIFSRSCRARNRGA